MDTDNMSYEELLALGESMGHVNTGLADEKISKCVQEVVCCISDQMQIDQDDGSCVICLEGYKDKDMLGMLKCRHDFHANCIKKWLQTNNSCPLCKAATASKCVQEVVCCISDQMQIDQDDQDDGSCVICLEGYKDKDMLGMLKCRHDFHADCIKKWLQTKNSCPLCKADAA